MSERESNEPKNVKIPSMLRKDSFNCLVFWDQILPHTEMSEIMENYWRKMVVFKILKQKKNSLKNKSDWLFVSEKNLYKARVYNGKRNKFTEENVVKHILSVRNLHIILNQEAWCSKVAQSLFTFQELPGFTYPY